MSRNQDFSRLLVDFVTDSELSFRALKINFDQRHLRHLHETRYRDEALDLLNQPEQSISPRDHSRHIWNIGVLFLLRCLFFAAPTLTPISLSMRQLAALTLAVQAAKVLPEAVYMQCSRIFGDLIARDALVCSHPSRSQSSGGVKLLELFAQLPPELSVRTIGSIGPTSFEPNDPASSSAESEKLFPVLLMDEFQELFTSTAAPGITVLEGSEADIPSNDTCLEQTYSSDHLEGETESQARSTTLTTLDTDPKLTFTDPLGMSLQLNIDSNTSLLPSEEPTNEEISEELRCLELLEKHAEEILVGGLIRRSRKKRTVSKVAEADSPFDNIIFGEVNLLNAPAEATEAFPTKKRRVSKRKRSHKVSSTDGSMTESGMSALEALEAQTRDLLEFLS